MNRLGNTGTRFLICFTQLIGFSAFFFLALCLYFFSTDYHILEKISMEKICLSNIRWYSAVTLDKEKEEGETWMGKEICSKKYVY